MYGRGERVFAWSLVALQRAWVVAGALRLGAGLTASPLPSPGAQLRTAGVYACVRHPIYSALLLGGAGVVAPAGRMSRVWIWLALLGLLRFKTRLEARKLADRIPGLPLLCRRDAAARPESAALLETAPVPVTNPVMPLPRLKNC